MPNGLQAKDWIIKQATEACLAQIDMKNLPSREARAALMFAQNDIMFQNENSARAQNKVDKLKAPDTITNYQIAKLIAKTEPIRCIRCVKDAASSEYDLLGIYQSVGPNAGIYETDSVSISKLIREYNCEISTKGIQEVIAQLREEVPHVDRCSDPDIIAVNNGLFNFKTKVLEPFSPDKVFLAKSRVDYNPNATNVVIHNPDDGTDWDVESWIMELANDDQEICNSIWEILSAICRPFVRWNKAAFLYSNTGNNGKGTLCVLMRNLVGQASCANIPLADFSKEFVLEPLIQSNCIVVDENDVGGYIDKAGNLKAVITGDTIQINRKYKVPIYYQFHGMMVQCINDLPRVRDKSNSFYRRQLFIPFKKCFTGAERTYIKNDYLNRQDVLEYVMYRVMNMSHYELSESKESLFCMDEYKRANDALRDFCDEILPQLKWDLVPFQFLFDLYMAWFSHNMSSGTPIGRNVFLRELPELIKEYPDWLYPGKTADNRHIKVYSAGNMVGPEPLILKYDLNNWKNKGYVGMDMKKICTPDMLDDRYIGIVRAGSAVATKLFKD